MVLYMANRYENNFKPVKWHDKLLKEVWENIKKNTDFSMMRWPQKKRNDQPKRTTSEMERLTPVALIFIIRVSF